MVTSIMHVQEEVIHLTIEMYPGSPSIYPREDEPLKEHRDHCS